MGRRSPARNAGKRGTAHDAQASRGVFREPPADNVPEPCPARGESSVGITFFLGADLYAVMVEDAGREGRAAEEVIEEMVRAKAHELRAAAIARRQIPSNEEL